MWDAVDDVLTNREPDLKFTVLCAENSPHRSLRIVLHLGISISNCNNQGELNLVNEPKHKDSN